jgi:hypothetical protein
MLGVPPEPPAQPPSGTVSARLHRVVLAVIIGLLVVTLVAVVATVAVLINRGLIGEAQAPVEAAPSSDPAADSEPSPPPQSPSPDNAAGENEESDSQALTEAGLEGWQGVAVRPRPLVYDVPRDWVVASPGMMYGFEEEDPDAPFGYSPRVMMSGVAYWPQSDPECEDTGPSAGTVGTSGMGDVVDTATGADGVAREWADAAFEHDGGDPELSVGEPEPFEANGLEGHMVTVRKRRAQPDEVCIELEIVEDEVLANISAPATHAPQLRILRIPLREAVIVAVKLSQRFDADIGVVDPDGLWPE